MTLKCTTKGILGHVIQRSQVDISQIYHSDQDYEDEVWQQKRQKKENQEEMLYTLSLVHPYLEGNMC